MKKIFLERLANLESAVVKTRQRRKFNFGTMSAAELWSLSVRASELRGFKQYYWEVIALTTKTPPPFVDLPLKLEKLGKGELIDICASVRDETQRRYVGDCFAAEAKLHADALDEPKIR